MQMKKDAPKHQNKYLIIKSKLRKQTFNKTVEEFLMELVIGEEGLKQQQKLQLSKVKWLLFDIDISC